MPFSDCNLFILIASIAHCCELHKPKNKTKDCREKARERERKKLSFIVFMFHGITQSKINILIYCYNSCRKVCLLFSVYVFLSEICGRDILSITLFWHNCSHIDTSVYYLLFVSVLFTDWQTYTPRLTSCLLYDICWLNTCLHIYYFWRNVLWQRTYTNIVFVEPNFSWKFQQARKKTKQYFLEKFDGTNSEIEFCRNTKLVFPSCCSCYRSIIM